MAYSGSSQPKQQRNDRLGSRASHGGGSNSTHSKSHISQSLGGNLDAYQLGKPIG